METWQIVIEPQKICPCGKSYLPMSAQERAAYDEAVRTLEEGRSRAGEPSTGKDGEHSTDTTDRN